MLEAKRTPRHTHIQKQVFVLGHNPWDEPYRTSMDSSITQTGKIAATLSVFVRDKACLSLLHVSAHLKVMIHFGGSSGCMDRSCWNFVILVSACNHMCLLWSKTIDHRKWQCLCVNVCVFMSGRLTRSIKKSFDKESEVVCLNFLFPFYIQDCFFIWMCTHLSTFNRTRKHN